MGKDNHHWVARLAGNRRAPGDDHTDSNVAHAIRHPVDPQSDLLAVRQRDLQSSGAALEPGEMLVYRKCNSAVGHHHLETPIASQH